MTTPTINILTDTKLYQKADDVTVTAIETHHWSTQLVVQVWDNSNHMIAEKKWDKPDNIDGHVTWVVAHSIFTSSDPQYTAQVLCNSQRAHVSFQHY